MAINQDALLRQWQMLRLIPRYPMKVTAGDIAERLADQDFPITKRTIERDLQALSVVFPLVVDDRSKPYGWSWAKEAAAFDLPSITDSEALTLTLVEHHLRAIMPVSIMGQLQPYFQMAAQKLSSLPGRSPAKTWPDKVRVVQPTQALLPAPIDGSVQQTVYDALLRDRQLNVRYRKHGAKDPINYTLHPLAIVQRGTVIYLICTLFRYSDPKMFALHRILSAEVLDTPVKRPKDFDIDQYIASGALGFGNGADIKLKAVFDADAAQHLLETPLSTDQVLTPMDDTHTRITATVADTQQLFWWLLAFGDNVEVQAPASLRRAMAETASEMNHLYHRKAW